MLPAIAPVLAVPAPSDGLSPSVAALLQSGGLLTAYIPESDGSGAYFTRMLQLFYSDGSTITNSSGGSGSGVSSEPSLYWAEAGKREMRPSRAIPLSRLRCIYCGKHSPVLQWSAISADPDRCFSLLWGDEILDVEADTESGRTDWLTLLDFLLTKSGRMVVEQPEKHVVSEFDGPIDPLSMPRRPISASLSRSASQAAVGGSGAAAVPGASSSSYPPGSRSPAILPAPNRFFEGVGSAMDLSFSSRKAKKFLVLDSKRMPVSPSTPNSATDGASPVSSSPVGDDFTTLAQTLQLFQSWMDVTPIRPPAVVPTLFRSASVAVPGGGGGGDAGEDPPPGASAARRTRASIFIDSRASAAAASTSPSAAATPASRTTQRRNSMAPAVVAPKDDPRSLEGSLSRLSAGVNFSYCSPPDDDEDPSATTAAAAATELPNEVPPPLPRRKSLSELLASILLFYAPQSRRATGRVGNFGQLSWCDSQVWTRKAAWKMPLHVDSTILLGKQSANLRRECYASLPEDKCFSVINGDAHSFGGSVDLYAEGGWTTIRAWLTDVDRILRSAGFAMVRAGGMGSSSSAAPALPQAVVAGGSPLHGSMGNSIKSLPLLAAPLQICNKLVFVSQADLAHAEQHQPHPRDHFSLGAGLSSAASGGGGGGGHRRERSSPPLAAALSVSSSLPNSSTISLGTPAFSATSSMASSSAFSSMLGAGAPSSTTSGVASSCSVASSQGNNSRATFSTSAGRDIHVVLPSTSDSPSRRAVAATLTNSGRRHAAPGITTLPQLERGRSTSTTTTGAAGGGGGGGGAGGGSNPGSPIVGGLSQPAQAALLYANSSPNTHGHHHTRGLSHTTSSMYPGIGGGSELTTPMDDGGPGMHALPTPSSQSGNMFSTRFRSPSDAAAAVNAAAASRASRRATARASGVGLPPMMGLAEAPSPVPQESSVSLSLSAAPLSPLSPARPVQARVAQSP